MTPPRMRLEFAPAARRMAGSGVAWLALSMALLIAVGAQWTLAWFDNARQARAIAEAQGRPTASPAVAPRAARADPAELARVQLVRQTSQSLATPWADLLAALEAAPATVALLSIEPSAAKRSVALTAEAADAKGMIDYLRALQADSRLSEVVLVSHQLLVQAPGAPLRFQVQARWGGTP